MAAVDDRASAASNDAVTISRAMRLFPDASPEDLEEISGAIGRTPSVAPSSIGASNPGTRNVALDSPSTAPEQIEPGLQNLDTINNIGEGVRDALPIVGGVAGAPAGLPGSIGGAFLGGMAKTAFESPGDDPVGALRGGRNEAAFEAVGGTAFDMVPGGIARIFRGDRGIAAKYTKAFEEFGLRPALQEISNTSFVEGARTIIGSFPVFSKPFAKFQERRIAHAESAINKFIEGASPDTLLMRNLAQKDVRQAKILNERLAGEFFTGIDKGIKFFKGQRDDSFKVLRAESRNAERAGEILGTPFKSESPNTLIRMNEVLKRIDAESIAKLSGGKVKKTPSKETTIDFIEEIALDTDTTRSLDDLINLKKSISEKINEVGRESPESATLLTAVKEGVEEDIDALLKSGPPKLREAYQKTLDFSSDLLTLLDSLSVRAVNQVDKKLGRQGAQILVEENGEMVLRNPGSKDVVALMDSLANSASPAQIRQFAKMLAGGSGEARAKKMMGDALGRKMSRVMNTAFKDAAAKSESGSFRPGTIVKGMGLDDPTSAKFAATVELFEQAGLDPNRTMKLVDLLDGMFSAKPGKAAQFVQRRAIMGGFKSALAGIAPGVAITSGVANRDSNPGGAAVGGGLVAFVGLVLITRSIGRTLTSPARARAVIAMADSALPNNFRARAMVSLLADPAIKAVLEPGSDDGFGNFQPAVEMREEVARVMQMLSTEEGRDELFEELDRDLIQPTKGLGPKALQGGARFLRREEGKPKRSTNQPLPSGR